MTQIEGSTRRAVWFSKAMRMGPGRNSCAPVGALRLLYAIAPLGGRLAGNGEEMRRVADRLEDDDLRGRKLDRNHRLLASRQFEELEGEFIDTRLQILRQVSRRAPENLAEIFHRRQAVRVVASNPAHARADGEVDVDHFVERGVVAGGAERTIVDVLMHRLQRVVGAKHAAAAGAEDVPLHLEEAEARGVEERGDGFLGVEAALLAEGDRIDAVEVAVGALGDEFLNRCNRRRVGRAPENGKEGF